MRSSIVLIALLSLSIWTIHGTYGTTDSSSSDSSDDSSTDVSSSDSSDSSSGTSSSASSSTDDSSSASSSSGTDDSSSDSDDSDDSSDDSSDSSGTSKDSDDTSSQSGKVDTSVRGINSGQSDGELPACHAGSEEKNTSPKGTTDSFWSTEELADTVEDRFPESSQKSASLPVPEDLEAALSVVEGSNLPAPISLNARTLLDLIRDGNIFIDKTMLLKELFQPQINFIDTQLIFTRPKGWGKSIMMSMIKLFCEAQMNLTTGQLIPRNRTRSYKLFKFGEAQFLNGEVRKLRNPLLISKEEDIMSQHQGQYPVVYITLENLKPKTLDEFRSGFASRVRDAFQAFSFEHIAKKVGCDPNAVDNLVANLASPKYKWKEFKRVCVSLGEYFGQKPIVLIDEYDRPMIELIKEQVVANESMMLRDVMSYYYDIFKQFSRHDKKKKFTKCILSGTIRMLIEFEPPNHDLTSELGGTPVHTFHGFKRRELELIFDHLRIPIPLRKEAYYYYCGYQNSPFENNTFSPISIAKFAANRKIGNYWTPDESMDMLCDRFLKNHLFLDAIKAKIPPGRCEVKPPYEEDLNKRPCVTPIEMENVPEIFLPADNVTEWVFPQLWIKDTGIYFFRQTGYLTRLYEIPNEEVKEMVEKKLAKYGVSPRLGYK